MNFEFAHPAVRSFAEENPELYSAWKDVAEQHDREFPGLMARNQLVCLTRDMEGNVIFCAAYDMCMVGPDGFIR